jgi:hypothetical protein
MDSLCDNVSNCSRRLLPAWIRHFVRITSAIFVMYSAANQASAAARPEVLDIDRSAFKSFFTKKYCRTSRAAQCDARWKNFSLLLDRATEDSRVQTVGFASYMFATVVIETLVRDLSPASVEIKHPRKNGKLDDYWSADRKTGNTYQGRGWVQLTRIEKYDLAGKKINVDLVAFPDRALTPDNSYEILVRALAEGWLETYRSDQFGGSTALPPPIRLGDFVSRTSVDYGHARAVVNANCIHCSGGKDRFNFHGAGFIPHEAKLDRAGEFEREALFFEEALCSSLKDSVKPLAAQ